MQGQLNEMAFHQQQLAHRQRKMEYKIGQFFAQSGYQIISHLPPLRMIEGVLLSFPLFSFICFYFMPLGTMSHFKYGGRDSLLLLLLGRDIDYY